MTWISWFATKRIGKSLLPITMALLIHLDDWGLRLAASRPGWTAGARVYQIQIGPVTGAVGRLTYSQRVNLRSRTDLGGVVRSENRRRRSRNKRVRRGEAR